MGEKDRENCQSKSISAIRKATQSGKIKLSLFLKLSVVVQ